MKQYSSLFFGTLFAFLAFKFISYEVPFVFSSESASIEILKKSMCSYKERTIEGTEIAFHFGNSSSLLCVPLPYTDDLRGWTITTASQAEEVKYIRYCNATNMCIYRNQKNNQFSFYLEHTSSFIRPSKPVF